jgi:succinate dehydrogenase / fumarate reductase cytochrome b subunit
MDQKARPVYLDLPKLASKMSITAKISILHRISGVLMFLAIPLALHFLHMSLTNPEFYALCSCVISQYVSKAIALVLVWALMHHMCAGVRFLFLDVEVGIQRSTAQLSARIVLVVSLLLTAAIGVMIW